MQIYVSNQITLTSMDAYTAFKAIEIGTFTVCFYSLNRHMAAKRTVHREWISYYIKSLLKIKSLTLVCWLLSFHLFLVSNHM